MSAVLFLEFCELEFASGLALEFIIFLSQQGEVIERSGWFGSRWGLGSQTFNLNMSLAVLDGDGGLAEASPIKPELKRREVEGVETEFEGASDKTGVYLVGIALQFDTPIFADFAGFAPAKSLDKLVVVCRANILHCLLVAFKRGLAGLGVNGLVVN